MNVLDKVVSIVGSQAKLAEKLEVGPMAVSHWRARQVPAGYCQSIERITNGEVTARDLRPDIFGDAA
ncbi:MAG: Cro/Cl family transcriptional regulator [Epsilonproteobacteria bacterium]|nr:MAG: Cro/Cl family transcriptional regulator [Campylobacterota bacterium]